MVSHVDDDYVVCEVVLLQKGSNTAHVFVYSGSCSEEVLQKAPGT